MTKQRTANVKMSRTVGVVWLVNPILIILHTVKFAEVLRQEAHGSYRSIRQSYQKTYLNCVQFFVRMCHRLYENRISVRIRAYKCEHIIENSLRCEIRQEVHGSYRSIRQSYQKKYINYVSFFARMRHRLYENRILLHFSFMPVRRKIRNGRDSTIENLTV